ncbi:DUF397 domain-containing protein [Streptomyces sp. 4F14]|uniref:DUF397 domain-containing protein n=1 Tax=Streptomyces sp. 4F14 TaxID=3394380 RepID=UPI003A8AD79D
MTAYAHTADEAGMIWRKSSYSGGDQAQCVEVAETAAPAVHVRDSKVSGGTSLTFAPTSFAAFTRYVSGVDA